MCAKKAKAAEAPKEEIPAPVPRLLEKYEKEILPKLAEQFGRANRHSLPKLTKIVVNMGVGKAIGEKKYMEEALEVMKQITGQKPLVCLSRKAISNFKLRENQPIGLMVTLRGRRMFDFLDRFCNIVSPRIRDFRGFNKKGDGRGNYNFGIEDQQIYPEINLDEVKRAQGMNITLVTTAQNDDDCVELLTLLGFPYK